MDPVRSSLAGGVAAMLVLLGYLTVVDAVFAGDGLFLFATFVSFCAEGAPPFCGGLVTSVLTFLWFGLLFGVAWPLLFAGFTWGLPGETGVVHGLVFGLFLWAGTLVGTVFGIAGGGGPVGANLPMLVGALGAYVLYGTVLGGVYDTLAEHRTFLSE